MINFTRNCLHFERPLFAILIERSLASYVRRKRNHYDVLGVPYDATAEEIKNAFVKKSQELHPDGKNFNPEVIRSMDKYAPDLTEQFMQLKTAYDILRRSVRRKQYDQMMGIERLKRFTKKSENLYDIGDKQYNVVQNFAMSAREFVSRDFYVRLADSSDNSLLYFTGGGLLVILVLQKLYVWYLESISDEKSGVVKSEEKSAVK
uniref:J domain-containing protein n=1 Tax=Setaria digitata TaxID=48799 RepID=A0A915PPZ8_9BILA